MFAKRRTSSFILILITFLTLMGFAFSSHAAAPTNIITYQGRLLNANSVPVSDASLSMKFFFYTALTGGTCVWSNSSATCDSNTPASTTARTVTLTSGLFTQNLGDTTDSFAAIADSYFADNSTLFLEVIVGSETLSPRRRLTAAPYALNAQTLDGIDSGSFLRDTGDSATGTYSFAGAVSLDGATTFTTDVDMTLAATENLTMTNSTATAEVIDMTVTSAGNDAQEINFTLGNDSDVDTLAALDIIVTSASTSDADILVGLNVANVSAADATVIERGVVIGSGWDVNLLFADTTSIIDVSDGGSLTFRDGTNTLMTLTDAGSNGTLSVGDLSCTDCLDFAELSDTLALDASTSIAMDGSETFTITDSGSGNTIVNLSSTGDFVIQDNGTAVLTINDDDVFAYSTDLTTTGAMTFTGNSLTTADLLTLSATALTTGSALEVTATNANTANSATRLSQFNLTNSQSSVANTDIAGLFINFTNSPTVAGNTERAVIIANQPTSNTTDNAVAALLGLDNGDTSTLGSTVVTDAILVTLSGAISNGIIDALDATDTNITNALNFGTNTLLGTTGDIDMTNFDVTGSSGNVVTAGDVAVNGGDITASGALTITSGGSGDLILSIDADSNIQMTAGSAPGVDMVSMTNASADVATNGVNAISIDLGVTNASTSEVLLDSTFTGGGTDDLLFAALTINDMNPTNTSGTDTVIGFDIAPVTDPGATITSVGMRIGSGYDTNIVLNDTTSMFDIANTGTLAFRDGTSTLMSLQDNGTNGILTIDNLSTSASAVNIYDVAVNKTIDIGGVDTNAADTVNIATNSSSADSIAMGNTNVATSVTITAGSVIDLEGPVDMDLSTINVAQFAVCHENSDTNDERIGDCSGAPTADYAEQYPVASGVTYGDIVVPGVQEVVTTDGATITQLVKSSRSYQGPIVGIVSNNYGDFTSAGYNIATQDNPMPVALVGRVQVKVTGEGGAIAVGDYLTTSSTAGRAMKATKVGRVIGMALQDWNGTDDTIMVQVNNSWYMGEVIGTDGVSTLVTDNVVVSSFALATAEEPTFDSYGLSLRGSAWEGDEAQAVEMMLQNTVESENEYRLSVRNTSETEVAYITQTGTMKIAGDMVIGGHLYPSDRGEAQTEKYIYYDGSQGAAGDFMRTNAKGWSTGSYDFAEMFVSNEPLVSGEVVVFSGSGHQVRRATGTDDGQLAGIVSTRPGFLAGENQAGSYPIALAGRVPTRVSVEHGAIAVGDPLTSSTTAGVAVKATESGQIVGYALEAYSGTGSDDLILAYVNVGYWQDEDAPPVMQNVASEVSSTTDFAGLNMSGDLSMNSYEITGIRKLTGMGNSWSLASDGTFTTSGLLKTVIDSYQNEKVETVAVTSPEVMITLTGTAVLENDQLEIRFEDVIAEYNDVISADAPIRVFVTPHGPVSLYVSESDQNHFVVTRFQGDLDVEFDWMVSAYRKGYEPVEKVDQVDEVDEMVQEDVQEDPSDSSILSDLEATDDPAPPTSPDTTLIDQAIESDGGATAEPEIESP
ncbi:hypothetical protein HZA87_03610 [Candidatus Uhrbacteria bacterium]|nr:hypothetical protein [Candidatus Uhrbacteria bacterium]